MMAVDTSALMAIVLRERKANVCAAALYADPNLLISAATLAEALIVSEGKSVLLEMLELMKNLGLNVIPVTAETAHRAAEAHRQWGKRRHPAGLNFGDCFAYDAAKTHACPLLYVGEDFRKTDLQSVL